MEIDKKLAHILIVDDNIKEANGVYDQLKDLGYKASFAFSYEEAESMIRINAINIIILDCFMPGINGPDLAQKIYSSFKSSISVILMSGIVKKSNIKFLSIPNIHTMVSKPVDKVELDQLIKEILKKQFYTQESKSIFSIISERVLPVKELNQKIASLSSLEKEDIFLFFSYLFHSKSEGILTFSKNKKFLKIYFYNGYIVYFDENNFKDKSIQYIKENHLLSEEIPSLSKIKTNIIVYTVKQSFLSPHHYTNFTVKRVFDGLKYFFNQKDFQINFEKLTEKSSLEDLEINLNFDQKVLINEFVTLINSFVDENLSEQSLKEKFKNLERTQLDLGFLKESSSKEPFLKNIINQRRKMKDICSIKEFVQSFKSEEPRIYTLLYKALIVNLIRIKTDSHEIQKIEKFYLKRFSYLMKEFESLSIEEFFKSLGCKNTNDIQAIKSIHKRFISVNHIDSFFYSSDELKDKILETLKIVNKYYDVLSDKNKMENYRKEQKQKESMKMVDFKELENKFQILLLEKNYDEIKKIMKEMKILNETLPSLENRIILYQMCFKMKERNYLIEDNERIQFSMELLKEHKYKEIKDLFLYVRGCLEICRGDLKSAQSCFEQSMEVNSTFNLPRLELINLKDKSTKTFSIFKKSS